MDFATGFLVRLTLLLLLCGGIACSDESDEDANFSGFWDFDLTVVGTPCPGDESGMDCFGIQQQGLSLLVVDDVHGNLRGSVDGRDATLSRQSPEESVLLELHMHSDGRTVSGRAVEADSLRACTTILDVEGTRRAGGCAIAQNQAPFRNSARRETASTSK